MEFFRNFCFLLKSPASLSLCQWQTNMLFNLVYEYFVYVFRSCECVRACARVRERDQGHIIWVGDAGLNNTKHEFTSSVIAWWIFRMECSTTMDEDQTICAIESQSAHAYHDRRGFERGGGSYCTAPMLLLKEWSNLGVKLLPWDFGSSGKKKNVLIIGK